MRRIHVAAALVSATLALSCGGNRSTPTTPDAAAPADISTSAPTPAAAPGPCTIGFDGLPAHGAPFGTHIACGLAVSASGAHWQASLTYGHPAPFIQFLSQGGTTTVGEVIVASADGVFTFAAADIYSSTTKIPYEMTGSLHGATVFTLAGVQGNTFGDFATIVNAHAAGAVDTLYIRLTNPAAPCCTNPVGLDNIRVAR